MNVCTEHLPLPVARFLTELAADHAFGMETVESFRKALEALDREADGLHPGAPEALKLMQCLAVICAEVSHPVRERFEALCMIVNLPKGKHTVTIQRAAV